MKTRMSSSAAEAAAATSKDSNGSTHGDMLYMSGLRWWKLSTITVIMTEMVHMIITAAKYTPTNTSRH